MSNGVTIVQIATSQLAWAEVVCTYARKSLGTELASGRVVMVCLVGSKSILRVVQVLGVSIGRVATTAVVRESGRRWMVVLVLESAMVGTLMAVAFVLEAV